MLKKVKKGIYAVAKSKKEDICSGFCLYSLLEFVFNEIWLLIKSLF